MNDEIEAQHIIDSLREELFQDFLEIKNLSR